jgi:hypothetical protein
VGIHVDGFGQFVDLYFNAAWEFFGLFKGPKEADHYVSQCLLHEVIQRQFAIVNPHLSLETLLHCSMLLAQNIRLCQINQQKLTNNSFGNFMLTKLINYLCQT